MLVGPSRSFVKTSKRSPSEFYYNHSILQTPINPYELISSTLHNNEFSPGTIIFPNRNENCRYNDIPVPDGATDFDLIKSLKMSRNSEIGMFFLKIILLLFHYSLCTLYSLSLLNVSLWILYYITGIELHYILTEM